MDKKVPQDEFLRKRALRQKKLRKRRARVIFCLFLILMLLISTILCFTVFFPIKEVKVTGSKIYTVEQILEASNIEKGDNLFSVSQDKTEILLKEKLPFIEKIEFDRTLPDTLRIKVSDAKEETVFLYKNAYYSVSKSGWVMKKYDKMPENLTVIVGVKAVCKVGAPVEIDNNDTKELVANLRRNLRATKMKINKIDVSNSVSIYLEVEDGITVKFGTANYIDEKIKHLAKVVSGFKKGKKGEINLSMYTKENPQCVFSAKK